MSEVLNRVDSPARITIDLAVASRVAEALNHAEEQIDLAVAAVAELQSKMLGARMHAGLAACVGQQALVNAGEAQTLLIQSRGAMVFAHKQLSKVQMAAGLESTWGPGVGKDMG
jgi:hypothetical protein